MAIKDCGCDCYYCFLLYYFKNVFKVHNLVNGSAMTYDEWKQTHDLVTGPAIVKSILDSVESGGWAKAITVWGDIKKEKK